MKRSVRVYVLGSGSTGNALLVEAGGTRVLVEAGVAPKTVVSRLAELGVDLRPGELHGIIATHHHGDHFGHANRLASVFAAPLFLHPGIDAMSSRPSRPLPSDDAPPSAGAGSVDVRPYDVGRPFTIGAITVTTVAVPHDAAQVAIRLDDGHAALGVATDVGRVTSGIAGLPAECDAALVEANHCTEMLAFSEYPDVVKRRVGGGWGHLSNEQTADLAGRLVGTRLARMWLGHLSRSNNTPARALEAVSARARRIDVEVVPESAPVAFELRSTKPYQLGLPF